MWCWDRTAWHAQYGLFVEVILIIEKRIFYRLSRLMLFVGRGVSVKKVRSLLLFICTLALLGHIPLVAQEKTLSGDQEKRAVVEAQEKRAAAQAKAQEKRAEAQEKTAAAKAKQAAAREAGRQKRDFARVAAQEKRAAAQAKRSIDEAIKRAVPPEGTFKFLGSRPDFKAVVKGAPYSATAITEYTQTLADGNQIMQKNEATYYRDREGRIRIDQKLKTIGKWTAVGEPQRIITIWDPVAGRYYNLDPGKQTAFIDPIRPPKTITVPVGPKPPPPFSGPSDHPKSPGPSISNKTKSDPVTTDSLNRRKKESLGTKTIEGVSADGTRTTRIIPTGEIGNVRPIEIVDESWYSPELQMLLLTRHNDPRSGETIYRLTNTNRRDPEPALFEIPAGYRILDKTAPRLPAEPSEPPKMPKVKKTEVIL